MILENSIPIPKTQLPTQTLPKPPQLSDDDRTTTTTMAAVDSVRWALPVLTILSALVVSLRLFCKKTRGIPVRQEDYTLVAAWVSEPRWRKLGSDEAAI
jgi:hypothetical protein